MEWIKRLSARAGGPGGWSDDFPLDDRLPSELTIDASDLRPVIGPLYAVRLRTFADWHGARGRVVRLLAPTNADAAEMLVGLGFGDILGTGIPDAEVAELGLGAIVLPVTGVRDAGDVERIAGAVRELLEYQMPDVSPLGAAAFMAVSELAGNAVDHGRNALGAYVCATRVVEPRRRVSIAIGDLGIGIPEHLRQQYPEWADDTFAVAQAMQPSVSGTGDPHRGNGFEEVFTEALASTLHAARIQIHSANGFVMREIVQERSRVEPYPAPSFRRGSCIAYDLVSAAT